MVGTTISHYKILEKIGQGGMGEVYLAQDTTLDRKVALKFLPEELEQNPTAQKRFLREAKSAAALDHPYICHIHEVGEVEDKSFIAMEYVQGTTLTEKLAEGPLPLKDALRKATEIAEALEAAHKKDIVHRDLKPSNIMLTPEGHVKVMDFGLAKRVTPAEGQKEEITTALTREGSTLGTIPYMSPEQVRGQEVDTRSDIFSFGVVLYEMLTGVHPFKKGGHIETATAILNEAVPPLTRYSEDIPLLLQHTVTKMLAKEPDRRYQLVHDVRNELEELKLEVDSGTDYTASDRPAHRWGLGIAGALGLALLAVGAALYYLLPASQAPSSTWSIRPLTSFRGIETAATWSPDGSFIAYGHTASGSMDIFVMSTAGGDPVRVTDDPADDVLPRWSPDGRYLAFLSDRGSGSNAYLIPALGGAERKLVETNLSYLERFDDVWGALGAQPWSPDGQELLFSRSQPTGEAAVWKVHLTTGEETQVTHPRSGEGDLYGSWSFDGNWIVFVRQRGGAGGLWLVPARGGEARVLLDEPYLDTQPAWASDSRRLVFSSNRSGQVSLWEIEVASGQLRQLTTGPWDWYPNVGSNGRLAFEQFSDRADLYWTQIGGGAEEQLTFNNADDYAPRFSPDGKRIAFHSNRTGNDEIWLLDLETKAERQLTDHPAFDVLPDWSPDANEIVFFSNREGEFQLWVMDAEGGAPRRLTEQPLSVSGVACTALRIAPRWSPDGEAIGSTSLPARRA